MAIVAHRDAGRNRPHIFRLNRKTELFLPDLSGQPPVEVGKTGTEENGDFHPEPLGQSWVEPGKGDFFNRNRPVIFRLTPKNRPYLLVIRFNRCPSLVTYTLTCHRWTQETKWDQLFELEKNYAGLIKFYVQQCLRLMSEF